MSDHLITSIVSVLLAIVGLAIIAVLVSNNAQTGSVLGAGGSAIGNAIKCALSPVTGGGCPSGGINATSSGITYGPIVNNGCFNDPNTGARVCPPGVSG